MLNLRAKFNLILSSVYPCYSHQANMASWSEHIDTIMTCSCSYHLGPSKIWHQAWSSSPFQWTVACWCRCHQNASEWSWAALLGSGFSLYWFAIEIWDRQQLMLHIISTKLYKSVVRMVRVENAWAVTQNTGKCSIAIEWNTLSETITK